MAFIPSAAGTITCTVKMKEDALGLLVMRASTKVPIQMLKKP